MRNGVGVDDGQHFAVIAEVRGGLCDCAALQTARRPRLAKNRDRDIFGACLLNYVADGLDGMCRGAT
jgi:hypothetical protein